MWNSYLLNQAFSLNRKPNGLRGFWNGEGMDTEKLRPGLQNKKFGIW